MANKKISELVEETNPSSNDELIFLDSSTADLKKVKLKNLTASDELNDIDFPFTVLGTTGESSVLNLSSISASAYSSNTNIKSVSPLSRFYWNKLKTAEYYVWSILPRVLSHERIIRNASLTPLEANLSSEVLI